MSAYTPGSFEAVTRGCTCDRYANEHGRGYQGTLGVRQFALAEGCPMHLPTPTAAHRIAARRRELGLTQFGLASRVGVSGSAVGMWESGVGVSAVNRAPLARALETTEQALFGDQAPRREHGGPGRKPKAVSA